VALAVPARLGARHSVLAGDVAQALGQLGEGGSNLDQLAGPGPAPGGGGGGGPQRTGVVLVLFASALNL
jgi:hypothetical protein